MKDIGAVLLCVRQGFLATPLAAHDARTAGLHGFVNKPAVNVNHDICSRGPSVKVEQPQLKPQAGVGWKVLVD